MRITTNWAPFGAPLFVGGGGPSSGSAPRLSVEDGRGSIQAEMPPSIDWRRRATSPAFPAPARLMVDRHSEAAVLNSVEIAG